VDGVGVVVQEGDAMAAWDILQMAERGELSLPDENHEFADDWNRRKTEEREAFFGREKVDIRNQKLESRNSLVVRCPRCGSENHERKKGVKALFFPGYRCRVCRWEWQRTTQHYG
jgi:hypothetical protein